VLVDHFGLVPVPSKPGPGVIRGLDAPSEPSARQTLERLTLEGVRKLINAHAFAASAKMPLNAHATIHLDRATGFRRDHWAQWQADLLERITRWLARHDIPTAYLWTREVGARTGAHLHLLLHLSDFANQHGPLTDYLHETMFAPDDVLSPPHAPVRITGGRYGMQTHSMRAGVLRYVLKGIDPAETHRLSLDGYQTVRVADALGITPAKDAPPIPGRCHGSSHSIGPAARHAAGWTEMRDLHHLAHHLNP